MKYYTFKRESNDFSDILKDPGLKKWIINKFFWKNHLMIGLVEGTDTSIDGYLILKYGDNLQKEVSKDFSPIPGKDYFPKR